MGRDYPNDSIAENGQNPEMSPGDLRRLAVTQTPVKNHQLTLMWKTLKKKKKTTTTTTTEKTMEHESDGDTNSNWWNRYSHQRISKETRGLWNKRTSGDHSNYRIIEIGQNTKKILEDLRRFAITQTPMENHQLMLVWKTLKWEKNSNNKWRFHTTNWWDCTR